MKKTTTLLCILLAGIVFASACAEKQPDRADLVSLMDQYLAALVSHDPAGLPLAEDVKLVENTEVTPIGEGLWKTSTGGATTDYKIYVADPVEQSVGFMGLHEEDGKPIQLGVRLKLENGAITEIDHMIWRTISDPMPEGLMKPRAGLIEPLSASEKVSRDEMVKASLAYYDAIEQSNGNVAPFADECQRHEGGIASANNKTPLPEGAGDAIGSMAQFGRMKCGEQLDTGFMAYITEINQRRVAAVDEEMGLVMIFSMFNHDGDPNPLPIVNVPGVTERANTWGKFNVGAAHIYKIRNGEIYEIEAMACLGEDIPHQDSDGWSCTRKCLADIMDQYLAALAGNDPTGAPLADDVMLVENTEKTPVGEGLWKTATGGPTEFKIIVADDDAGEVAFMGVIEENGHPTIAAIRLKVVDHEIKEIDHLVIHNEDGTPLNPNMSYVRPPLLERLPKVERIPNDRMKEIANSYYDAIVQDNGDVAPFADECQRRENGGISAGDLNQAAEKDDFSTFRKMKCGEQLSTGVMSYITDITDRRVFAVDEEKGLVFAFSIFRHNGEPKVMEIVGVPGVTERANEWEPFELPAAHIYKIRNGKIHEIEAIGYFSEETGLTTGWEPEAGE